MIDDLYIILEQDLDEITIKLAPKSHPIFQAHFPDLPLLPGFAFIDIMAEILDDSIINIHHSKFITHCLPNDILVCKIKTEKKKRNIKIFKNEKKVSEIIYESK